MSLAVDRDRRTTGAYEFTIGYTHCLFSLCGETSCSVQDYSQLASTPYDHLDRVSYRSCVQDYIILDASNKLCKAERGVHGNIYKFQALHRNESSAGS